MPPLITVVVPTYNASAHLAQALQSVQAQSAGVAETIVVDDCSSDNSPEIATALGARVLTTPRNSGPSAARNIGWRAARTPLVAFLDADDHWATEHCRGLLGVFDAVPGVGVAFARVQSFGDRSSRTPAELPVGVSLDLSTPLMRRNLVPQIGVMVRRDVLERVGGYDERYRYSEDYDLWLRLSSVTTFACTHDVTAFYRVHAQQATRAAGKLVHGSWIVRHEHYERIRELIDAAVAAEVRSQMRLGWEDDLRTAWHLADRALLRETLALHHLVPDADGMRDRWERRARLFWRPWQTAKYVWARTPAPLIRGVRRLRGIRMP